VSCSRYFNVRWHTPRSRVLLEKLTVTQLLKFRTFYGTRRFITVFTRARHWSLSWARWILSTSSRPLPLRSILILSYHLCLGLPSGVFPSDFPTNILYAFFIYACYVPHQSHPWFCHPNNIWRSVQVRKVLMRSSSVPCLKHCILSLFVSQTVVFKYKLQWQVVEFIVQCVCLHFTPVVVIHMLLTQIFCSERSVFFSSTFE
jgi:hypothetical protein